MDIKSNEFTLNIYQEQRKLRSEVAELAFSCISPEDFAASDFIKLATENFFVVKSDSIDFQQFNDG